MQAVARHPGALKTIFELQARDWNRRQQNAIPDQQLADWMRLLRLNGVKNYGYYPDDFINNQPDISRIRPQFSSGGTLTMTDRIIALCILCLVFGLPLGVAAVFTGELILDFVFFWPLFMSVLWITGVSTSGFSWNVTGRGEDTPPPTLPGNPLISILIPCFNEEKNARETISAALAQRYANLEVIAINDGSSDNTARVLQQLAQEEPRLRVIHLAANQGKAVALKAGAAAARGDLLVCIDGDALLDRDTAARLVAPLIHYPHVGAVTGNPRIRTRSTLIGRIQVGSSRRSLGLSNGRSGSMAGSLPSPA